MRHMKYLERIEIAYHGEFRHLFPVFFLGYSTPEGSISGSCSKWNVSKLFSNRHQNKLLCNLRKYLVSAHELAS